MEFPHQDPFVAEKRLAILKEKSRVIPMNQAISSASAGPLPTNFKIDMPTVSSFSYRSRHPLTSNQGLLSTQPAAYGEQTIPHAQDKYTSGYRE